MTKMSMFLTILRSNVIEENSEKLIQIYHLFLFRVQKLLVSFYNFRKFEAEAGKIGVVTNKYARHLRL